MKIAIIGAHRVGKTSLAEKIQESFPDYNYIREPYYDLEEAGHVFSEASNVEDYIEQLEYSFSQISKYGKNVIFDRAPIDILAYIQAMTDSGISQSLYNRVQSAMEEIDLIVFVPIENPDLISCRKFELPELRFQVNEILNEWIWDFDLKTIEVKGTLLARRDQILKKISEEENNKLNAL
jgi:GTPase SAR1 family protein